MKSGVTRAWLYLRQSDTSDAGEESLSLDSQDTELRARAAREGWVVVGASRDPDLKGWMDERQRPGIAEVLRQAKASAYDILVVWDLSRFVRLVRLQEQMIYELAQHGVTLVSHTEEWVANPLFRQILGAVAEEQTRTISRHIRRSLAERRRRGLRQGAPPTGYQRDAPDTPYSVDPRFAPIVKELFERFDAGEAAAHLADDLTLRGIQTPRGYAVWRTQTICGILDNPVYACFLPTPDGIVPGQHPPLISPELWKRVVARRAERRRPPKRKPEQSWLEGLFFHAAPCGARLYLNRGQGSRNRYFRCDEGDPSHRRDAGPCALRPAALTAAIAEAAVRELLATDLGRLAPLDEVVAVAESHFRESAPFASRRRRDLQQQQTQLERRRSRAEDLYLSGSRDRTWFDAQEAAVTAELTAITEQLAALPAPPDVAALRHVAEHLHDAGAIIRDPDLPPAALGEMLVALGHAELGPDGIRVCYRPEIAQFLGTTAPPRQVGRLGRSLVYQQAWALRPQLTWPQIWERVHAQFPEACPPNPTALQSGSRYWRIAHIVEDRESELSSRRANNSDRGTELHKILSPVHEKPASRRAELRTIPSIWR